MCFRFDPTRSWSFFASASGTIRSFSPCSTRNAHSIRWATPSSVNFFAHSSGLVVGRAHHPAELEDRGRARARIGREPGLVAGDPIINVPMHGAERDRGGVAPLEGGNARRVIAAEAVAHHRDAVGIDLRAGGDVVVSGGAGDLVIVTAVDVAQAQRFGLAGPVD